ncbi:MAG: DUF3833 family protein [Gemmatimonadaceae bacterium]
MSVNIVLRLLSPAALLLVSGCLSASPLHTSATEAPEFRPEAFFAGVTHGEGTLVQRGKGPRKLRVEGLGQPEPGGTFRLEQTVTFDDGATERRTWHLRQMSAHTYMGIISDASGKVSAETKGNRFHLRYLLRKPAVYMEQYLYLQPDGRTVLNVATVTVIGIPWARLSEKITRSDEHASLP